MKNNNTTIYIVRHGESEANAKGILQGQKDYPLTPKGEEQAVIISNGLKGINFDAIFSSDLLRAKRTAEIIAIERKLLVNTTKVLRERNYGRLEGLDKHSSTEETIALFDRWNQLTSVEWLKHRIVEDAETGEEMVARMITFIREIGVTYGDKNILVVSHADMMRNFLVHLGWATHIELRGKTITNTGYIKLETDGVEFFIQETSGITKNVGSKFNL